MVPVRPRGARSLVENGRTEDLRPLAESEHRGAGTQRPRGPCSAGCRTSLCRVERIHGAHQNFERIACKRFFALARQSQTYASPVRLEWLSDQVPTRFK